MQLQPYIFLVRILVYVVGTVGIEQRGTPLETMKQADVSQEMLREESANLTYDAVTYDAVSEGRLRQSTLQLN